MAEKHVLVIEDNELNLKLMKAFLDIGKYRALTATDAETGIQLAREQRPDLIIMDIQLPGLDGLSATRIIKNDPDLQDLPVIGLSGFARNEDREQALDAGCSDYLTKPVELHQFLDAIAKHF